MRIEGNKQSVHQAILFRVKMVRYDRGAVGGDGVGGDADDSVIATH